MQRTGRPQYGINCPTETIDLRGFAGGVIVGVTATGTGTFEVKVNGQWKTLTVNSTPVTIPIGDQGEVIPDAAYHAGICRLAGVTGTIDVEPKS